MQKPDDHKLHNTNKLITIAEPCHENWNHMTPNEKGRHCTVCNKVVIDFTKTSRKEIITHLENSKENTCGKFLSEQIHSPKKTTAKLTKIAASILAITGINDTLHSQNDFTLKGEMILEPIEINASNQTSKILSGQINDPNLNPIQNAKISVFSAGKLIQFALSNAAGKYTLKLHAGSVIQDLVSIKINAKHFNPKTLDHLALTKSISTLDISLERENTTKPKRNFEMMGGARIDFEKTKIPSVEKMPQKNKPSATKIAESTSSRQGPRDNNDKTIPNTNSFNFKTTQPTLIALKPKNIRKSGLLSNVYPNPTKDWVKLQVTEPGSYQYYLTDAIGNLIAQGGFEGTVLAYSFQNHTPGIYFFELKKDNTLTFTTKVIVEK